jgi:hypothetical protein
MSTSRQEQIAERLEAMPRKYRQQYKKAVAGRSLRACVNAQCLECVYWISKEVTLCTDLGCPLYAVRPYQRSAGSGRQGGLIGSESKKEVKKVSG